MITCEIITPYGPYRTIETSQINVVTIDGQRGLLEHHMPIVLILEISALELIENGVRKKYAISGGALYFEKGHARIMVNSIEASDEIDVDRAKKAKRRAEDRLSANDHNIDIKRAEIALKKAINRISLAK